MKAVIIAEKPSVAKNIADALKIKTRFDGYYEGDTYIVTWVYGHLLQLYDAKDYDEKMNTWQLDNFPFIPEKFRYKVKNSSKDKNKPDSGASNQLRIIRSLLFRKDVNAIISACDYDREGQVIGDSVIYHIKASKQVYRLLLNEWTPEEVIKGLKQMKLNSDLRPLQDAGVSRQWADWTIGINLTSVATLKYQKGKGQTLNIGRVLLPTLKIIYDRDKEIERFVPENYYKLIVTFKTKKEEEFETVYIEEQEEQFKSKVTLEDIYKILQHSSGEVVDKQVERKKEYPPFLFNLSHLQGFVTSKYKGWTADKVLKVAQSLYEKKYITYPRTGSTAIEESLMERVAKVIGIVKKGLPYENDIAFVHTKRVFNNAKVESHSAIIPTYVAPKSLTHDEAIVYETIKNRFIMQFMPVAEHEETRVQIKLDDSSISGMCVAKGRVQIVEGWRKVEKIETKDKLLPFMEIKDNVDIVHAEITSHVTKPPKYHTEKTLLRVMETCGKNYEEEEAILEGFSIGTPATRAETIKKLKDIGYIFSKEKTLSCSELGRKIVEIFPVKELFDLEFTGRLEKALSDMEKQKVSKEVFLNFIFEFTKKSVIQIKNDRDVFLQPATKITNDVEMLGKCPVCSGVIVEGMKGFGCTEWRNGCKFVIWKNDKFLAAMNKKPTKTMVKKLLKDGNVLIKGLVSKKGNKFDAIFTYEKNPGSEFFNWKMNLQRHMEK
ncbi:DNA topoisomerase [Bacillus thuringiensis]|uniref:type IA DNA topoisomerase n=1 Tax=Bacillus thuringiensis TaxID=1428 RepID=UPI000E47F574|nr:type IA DNA topoisomerase [Bacillus thuringiensis]MDZ3952391.1 DNA topoisomerase [Bacillus thuringiensis]RGP45217.1 DNA topoisomerase III [Bacillus thuringiensis]